MNIRKILAVALIYLFVSSLAQAQSITEKPGNAQSGSEDYSEEVDAESFEAPAEAPTTAPATATQCEKPTKFKSDLEDYSEAEADRIGSTLEVLSKKLQEVIEATKEETISIMEGFEKYALSRASYQDAMNKIAVIRNRQAANARIQTKNRIEDFDDKACARATNAPNFLKTRAITNALKEQSINRFSNNLTKVDPVEIKKKNIENIDKYFSQKESRDVENPFKNADINAKSLFSYKTFKNAVDNYGSLPSSDRTPNTQIAAEAYINNLIDNDGINLVNRRLPSNEQQKDTVINNSKISRKNLAYSFLADMVAKRSTIPGSGTGTALRGKYTFLSNKGGTGFSASQAPNIADDISEYEFKDFMYSKLYMNPDWALSLPSKEKELKNEELEIVNKNMSLEWDTLLLLEELATADSVGLAAAIDASR